MDVLATRTSSTTAASQREAKLDVAAALCHASRYVLNSIKSEHHSCWVRFRSLKTYRARYGCFRGTCGDISTDPFDYYRSICSYPFLWDSGGIGLQTDRTNKTTFSMAARGCRTSQQQQPTQLQHAAFTVSVQHNPNRTKTTLRVA
eukprot:2236259-Amphidinium_carterae.1